MSYPFKQMSALATRTSLRRTKHQEWSNQKNKPKARIWHRACKRSLKNFMKQSLIKELNC